LTAAVYNFLDRSDADYARFLHDEGHGADGDTKKFKLFTFSLLRGRRLGISQTHLRFAPGPLEWLVSSPVSDFTKHFATGLLASGRLAVGPACFEIASVEALPAPDFDSGFACLTCLSPIVVSKPLPDGKTYYIRPTEGTEFSEGLRRNLIAKHGVLHGVPPENDAFTLAFDPAYLERHRGGTKLQTFKETQMVGAFAPCRVVGSPELLKVGYEAGFGKSTALGLGMVGVTHMEQTR
jgi:CRISPR-associated endoribonuclease Cas6